MSLQFQHKIKIGKKFIGDGHPTYVIAEAGVNHNGDLDTAKRMVDLAAENFVDSVKFQAFDTNSLILKTVEKAKYQIENMGTNESQYEMLKKLEVSKDFFVEIKKYCESKNILFLVTPFDEPSLDLLEDIGVEAYKISSTDLTNLPFIRKIASKGKPVILSSGMSYIEEVALALKEVNEVNQNIILLHCTGNYPTPEDQVNLRAMTEMKKKFNILIGYSDHTAGVGASPSAVAAGAKVIEKHITLDKNMDGPDHVASLDPIELENLMMEVRKVEKFLGDSEKKPQPSEENTRKSLQKNLVARVKISKGEAFSLDNIVAKRTGGKGVSPIRYREMLGQKAEKEFEIDEILTIKG